MPKRKLRIVGLSNQDTAVYLYRIIQPLQEIARQKRATVHHLPIFGTHANYLLSPEFREYQALEGKWADVLFSTIGSDRYYLSVLLAMKERYKLKLVIDLDDDVLATAYEPNNPAFGAFTSGKGLHAEYAQLCLQAADLVTVSTPYLKRRYEVYHKNIVVVPNAIDPRLFSTPNASGPLTIGYAGSGSHQKDWEMIEPTLTRLKERHAVKLSVLGPMLTNGVDSQIPWTETLQYPRVLAEQGFSIGVAPLKDSLMARAKSNLRWLEYSALKIPTVASNVVPFRDIDSIIRVSELEEWESSLARLLEYPNERHKLGEQAYTEAMDRFSLAASGETLFKALAAL